MKVVNVVGARPNFMKIAPIIREMNRFPAIQSLLVHTGQHYDFEMSQTFFQDLDLPMPDFHLDVGSGSHAVQTARVMMTFEDVLEREKPDLVLVVGDVNSTLACALVASKLCIPVAHVEAGLRSFDRTMPEEVNRLLTDQLSDLLFVTSPDAVDNLLREGIAKEKIHSVGNVMIDSLCVCKEKALASNARARLGLGGEPYVLLTLHRPSNVDDPVILRNILQSIQQISRRAKVLFPVHPRTAARVRSLSDPEFGSDSNGIIFTNPLGRIDFLNLLMAASLVLTDSGGIQEETTFLQIPCLTLRDNTERPVTVSLGTNCLVGTDPEKIVQSAIQVLSGEWKHGRIPDLWDGHAAERIVQIVRAAFC
jgi:UDP-N-acetylglucosamine 2-epimerase (non-hydrolysing)